MSSGVSTEREQSEEEPVNPGIVDWFVQAAHGREARVYLASAFPPGQFPFPMCRDQAFDKWPQEFGVGMADLRRSGYVVCPACFKKAVAEESSTRTKRRKAMQM